jgi:hypothetical protein
VAGNATKDADGVHVVAELRLLAPDLIEAVEDGRTDVSCGYDCRLDAVPGVSPEGEPYDFIQREIEYNHVAIVPRGRAGTAALRLDAEGNQIPERDGERTEMKTQRIDGVDYEIGTDAHKAALARLEAAEAARQKRLDTAEAERDALASRVKDLETRLDEASKALPALVVARVKLIEAARSHEVEVRVDADTDRQIQEKILGKLLPFVKLVGTSDDYLPAALDLALRAESGASAARVRQDVADLRIEEHTDAEEDETPPWEKKRAESLKNMSKIQK